MPVRAKAAGFVSYGGVSGGLRSVQMTKLLLTSFKIVPIVEQVAIPFVAKLIENGRFVANETHDKSATAMLESCCGGPAHLPRCGSQSRDKATAPCCRARRHPTRQDDGIY